MRKLLLLASLCVFFVSCTKKTKDGTYIIYRTEMPQNLSFGPSSIDFDASEKLGQRLKGKKFKLEFHDRFIIAKQGSSREEMVFDKKKDDDGEFYELVFSKGHEKWNMVLYEQQGSESKNIMMSIRINVYRVNESGYEEKIKDASTKCELQKL